MVASDRSGGAGRLPGNNPEREKGKKRWPSYGSETEKVVGDDDAAGDAGFHLGLQRLEG